METAARGDGFRHAAHLQIPGDGVQFGRQIARRDPADVDGRRSLAEALRHLRGDSAGGEPGMRQRRQGRHPILRDGAVEDHHLLEAGPLGNPEELLVVAVEAAQILVGELDPRRDLAAAHDVGTQLLPGLIAEVLFAHARLGEGVPELLLGLDAEPLPSRLDLLLDVALVDDDGELVRTGEDQLLLEQRLHDDLADLAQLLLPLRFGESRRVPDLPDLLVERPLVVVEGHDPVVDPQDDAVVRLRRRLRGGGQPAQSESQGHEGCHCRVFAAAARCQGHVHVVLLNRRRVGCRGRCTRTATV